jgi:16S rRNA (uracil1498-N3)-methyltransferase
MTGKRLIIDPGRVVGQRAVLDGPLYHHLRHVLRCEIGAALDLADGEGRRYLGRITAITEATIEVEILDRAEAPAEPAPRLTLVYGLARGGRTDWTVQKSTELGLACFMPALCQRSVSRPRTERKVERWREVARQAARQSHRGFVPEILPPRPLAAALEAAAARAELRLIATPEGGTPLTQHAPTLARPPAEVALAVGPEGGFTDDELSLARAAGFVPVTLGPSILRSETAAIVIVALASYLAGRLTP